MQMGCKQQTLMACRKRRRRRIRERLRKIFRKNKGINRVKRGRKGVLIFYSPSE
jgi:hypothetical protein